MKAHILLTLTEEEGLWLRDEMRDGNIVDEEKKANAKIRHSILVALDTLYS